MRYLLASEETIDREYGALEKVEDNYTKLFLSLGRNRPIKRGGIIWKNIVDFLLERQSTTTHYLSGRQTLLSR